jgi:hypothetical protein
MSAFETDAEMRALDPGWNRAKLLQLIESKVLSRSYEAGVARRIR